MTDFLGDLLAELTGTGNRRFTTWLDALQVTAPEYAHDIATEQQARERWVEIAASVHRHPDTPHHVRATCVRVLEAIAGTTDPMSTQAPHEPSESS